MHAGGRPDTEMRVWVERDGGVEAVRTLKNERSYTHDGSERTLRWQRKRIPCLRHWDINRRLVVAIRVMGVTTKGGIGWGTLQGVWLTRRTPHHDEVVLLG